MSLFGSEEMNRIWAGGIKPTPRPNNEFSNWTNKHREMNNLPTMPSKAPFEMPPKQPLPNKIPMSSGGFQPSQPPNYGGGFGGMVGNLFDKVKGPGAFQGVLDNRAQNPNGPLGMSPVMLQQLLQLFGSNQMPFGQLHGSIRRPF